MKKTLLSSLIFGLTIFAANSVSANTVNFHLDKLELGKFSDLVSLQLDFLPIDDGMPYDWDVTASYGPAFGYDSKSKNGVNIFTLLNDEDQVTGLTLFQKWDDKPFKNGLVFKFESPVNLRVDTASIQLFGVSDTATPVSGLKAVSTFDANNNELVTMAPVPVPAAIWLLGSGFVGLAGLRRKKK